jgi:hypothetical protein
MKLLFTVIVLILSASLSSSAKWVEGSIITNDSTVIEGKIYLNDKNLTSKDVFIRNGVVLNEYYREVFFKQKGRKAKLYTPNEVLEYCFKHDGQRYSFKSFELHYKSIVKAEREKDCFLQLIYSGHVCLYRHISESLYTEGVMQYEPTIDYYIFNEGQGLTRVERGKNYERIQDILLAYGFDKRYVDDLKSRINIRDISQIISDYDVWKEDNAVPTSFKI